MISPAAAPARRAAPALLPLFALALLGPPRLGAQSTPLADRAAEAFAAQAWKEALPLLEQLVAEDPRNALAHLRLGVVRLHLGQGRAGNRSYSRRRRCHRHTARHLMQSVGR